MADENMNTIHITEKQKVQEITDKLEEGLKELFESEKYKTSASDGIVSSFQFNGISYLIPIVNS